jgi:PKD repeat protein
MKLRVLILAALVLVASFGLAHAQTVSVDHVDGLAGPGAVNTDVPITFHIRMAAEGTAYSGLTNAFEVSSPSGATWTGTTTSSTSILDGDDFFDFMWRLNSSGVTGSGADTVALVASVMDNPIGMPADFDDVVMTIEIGPIDPADAGGEICLDSVFLPPSTLWKWAGSGSAPEASPFWGGPYCYTIGAVVIDPPVVDCPDAEPIMFDLCAVQDTCIDLAITDANSVVVTGDIIGATWADGQLCFTSPPTSEDYAVHIEATNDGGMTSCDLTLTFAYATPLEITCPTDTIDISPCTLEEVCVPLPIAGALDVEVDNGGTWDNDELCFTPTGPAVYEFTVTAVNLDCGWTEDCVVYVKVDVAELPVISYPVEIVELAGCEAGNFCFPLEITGYDEVRVYGGATFEPGDLCFDVTESGMMTFEIAAENCAGIDSCTVTFDVFLNNAPTVDLEEPTPVELCNPSPVTLSYTPDDLDEEPLTEELISPAGTIDDEANTVTFTPQASGIYEVIVQVTDSCGAVSADTSYVDVTILTTPEIECPLAPVEISICAPGPVCFPLAITGDYAEVSVFHNGSWANDEFCFEPDTAGIYEVAITASSCDDAYCEFQVIVSFVEAPTACFDFEFSPSPLGVQFNDCSVPDGSISYLWDFGDGNTSTESAPEHFYGEPGCYDVNLNVTLDDCDGPSNDVSHEVCVTEPTGPMSIDCPQDVITVTPGDTICMELLAENYGDVWIENATPDWFVRWNGSELCFDATVAGNFDATLIAYHGKEKISCVVSIEIQDDPCPNPPIFECPSEPFVHQVCGDPVDCEGCFYLPIEFAGEVTTDYEGATWANDTLCLVVDTLGTYTIEVTAFGEGRPGCDPVSCIVEITIEPFECFDIILSEDEFFFTKMISDVGNPETQPLIVSSTDDPFCFDLIPDGGFEWFSVIESACTGTEISLSVNTETLPVGQYSTIVAVDASACGHCDPATAFFTVYLEILPDLSEEDALLIPTVPSVPGARVGVPISIEHPCYLDEIAATFNYYTDQMEYDSAAFSGTLLADWTDLSVTVDAQQIKLNAARGTGSVLSPGAGVIVTLWFTVDHMATESFYALDASEAIFSVDCYNNGSFLPVEAAIITGGVIVGPLEDYICGYVVDPDMNSIEGATVELWADFPVGSAAQVANSNATGLFEFFNTSVVPFDLYAYKAGYYPATVENLDYSDNGLLIVLTPIEEVVPTDEWVNFYCHNNLYMGEPMPIGSVIDAYDPDGVHCGTFTVDDAGAYGFLTVYHDDPYTAGIDEGAEAGDIIRLYVNGIEAFPMVTPIWTGNGGVHEVCLDISNDVPHACHLVEGWNLVSWNVDTEIDSIESVMASISDKIDVVLAFENGGLTWDPDLPLFSNLSFVDHLSGYWIRTNDEVTLEISGRAVPATTPISVDKGWNLVSYLPSHSEEPEVALASLAPNLQAALGYDNGFISYEPGDELHQTMDSMSSCFGYWLRLNRPKVLIYPGSGPVVAPQINRQPVALAKIANDIQVTQNWMNIYATELQLDGNAVSAGANITAHNSAGTAVGSFTIAQDGLFGFMAVYGDDETTNEPEGVRLGDSFTLKIDGIETNENFTWTQNGDRVEIGSLTAKSGSDAGLPDEFQLLPNYPNPFNPSTNIGFSLPKAGKAKLVVFNILGREVATVFDAEASAGYNEVTWDGRSDNGGTVSSGVYFYRLTTESYTETRKMMLLK